MKDRLLLGAVAAMMAASQVSAAAVSPSRMAVQSVLDASAAAWSSGELDRFMECYEHAPGTSYVGGGKVVRGYDAIRSMYSDRFGGGDRASTRRFATGAAAPCARRAC